MFLLFYLWGNNVNCCAAVVIIVIIKINPKYTVFKGKTIKKKKKNNSMDQFSFTPPQRKKQRF